MRTCTSLGHREADAASEAIQAELTRRSKAADIAVSDVHGELVTLVRLDGAPPASILIAANKAWTAARERRSTREIGQSARDPQAGFDMAYYGDPRCIAWGGGVPVVVEGSVVGAVVVSGLSEQEDMELAGIGVAAIVAIVATSRS